MPKIYVLSGPDLGRSFEIADGAKLGRGVNCEIHLRDVSVSREHARIAREGGSWRVVDTNSRNGVSVGGERVPSALLEDGTEFLVGEILLRFRGDAVVAPDEIVLEEDPAPEIPPARPAHVASDLERTVLSAPRPSAAVPRGQGILQYKKIQNQSGFFASDLAQQPLWVRLGIGLVAIAVFAAIFLFAFKGTAFLKKQASGGSGEVDSPIDR